MLPLFGDEQRRQINLGGKPTATSHTAILDQAKARRSERQNEKRRYDNAVRIQAWWRGLRAARLGREDMRRTFEGDVDGLTGLRCLFVMGGDAEALGLWSAAMLDGGQG